MLIKYAGFVIPKTSFIFNFTVKDNMSKTNSSRMPDIYVLEILDLDFMR